MNCQSYLKLIEEGTAPIFIAEILYSIMQSEKEFENACKSINRAKKEGYFEGVKFYPKPENEPIYPIETTTIA